MSGAEVSVRLAWADDAASIAGVQIAAWRRDHPQLWPSGTMPTAEAVAGAWASSLRAPSDARMRVLLALAHDQPTGFAVLAPALDPDLDPIADGEITALVLDPNHRGEGHGSRLLQACADTLGADRFTRAVTWVESGDVARHEFLVGAGWSFDGARRVLDVDDPGRAQDGPVGDGGLTQLRLHTALA